MISVVVVPVVRSPGVPVCWVVAPVPVRAPYNVGGSVDESYQRPCANFDVSCGYHCIVSPVFAVAIVSGIGCLGVVRLDNVIPPVQIRVADQLYLHLSVTKLLDSEDCKVLVFVPVECGSQHNRMNVAVNKILDHDVVDKIIVVKVEVIDPGIFIIQVFFETFKCFRFLEQVHHGVKVEVVTWQSKVLCRVVLCSGCASCCYQQCEDRCDD